MHDKIVVLKACARDAAGLIARESRHSGLASIYLAESKQTGAGLF